MWRGLEHLSTEQRAVIVQRYFIGYSETEMSAELQRPKGTVKWLLHSARQRLRNLLLSRTLSTYEEEQRK